MIRECIILAGGLGTRLRTELPDTPKVLAPVAGKPFLYFVFQWLERNGVTRVVLSLGYRSNEVMSWCKSYRGDLDLIYSVESEPLGTGGAIAHAMKKIQTDMVFVTNGDTLFEVDLNLMERKHRELGVELSIGLKPMERFDRYGAVLLDERMRITGFEEKGFHEKALINGGVYLINRGRFESLQKGGEFSFERDFLEVYPGKLNMYGFVQDSYFIDIGVPDDYTRAQKEFGNK